MKIRISFRDHEASKAVMAVGSLKKELGRMREHTPTRTKDGVTIVHLTIASNSLTDTKQMWYNNSGESKP